MTVPIQQVSNTSTFYFWKTQTNLMANALSTSVLSTDGVTVGNVVLDGSFYVNNVNTTNISATGNTVVKKLNANNSFGSNGQVLTSNGSHAYWSSIVGSVTTVNTGGGIKGGPITNTGTVSLDLYSGLSSVNTNYPVGSIVAVYTGINSAGQRAVASVDVIYTGNLQGIAGNSGDPLSGTWSNRGLSATDYRSPTETRYYYLYQRVA